MNPLRYLPSRWHQADRSATAERIKLPRPRRDSDPLDDWPPSREDCAQTPADWRPPPPRSHFIPRPRENRSAQQPRLGGSALLEPQPRFVPRPNGHAPAAPAPTAPPAAPLPPVTPWQPPAIDRPGQTAQA